MFAVSLHHADHVRRYSISATTDLGWEIRLEEDEHLQRLDHYHDWHRVERTLAFFEREVHALEESGWKLQLGMGNWELGTGNSIPNS